PPPPPPPPPPGPPPPPPIPAPPLVALGPHPRIWVTPARLTAMKAQIAANSPAWQLVKSTADGEVALGFTQLWNFDNIPDLCLAYLGTGNQAYATRVGIILDSIAVPSNDLSGDDAYNYRYLGQYSAGLDWCYNGLTTAQHHHIATWLMDRADWVWPQTNPGRAGAWGVGDYEDNYWWGFMQTGPAAIVA